MLPQWWGVNLWKRLLLDWTGDVVLTRNPIASNSETSREHAPVRLPARWLNRERVTRVDSRHEHSFVFETILTSEVLNRIDDFRNGSSIFARLEGEMLTLIVERTNEDISHPYNQPVKRTELWNQLSEFGRSLWGRVVSEPYELSRDFWSRQILGTLRPPGRVLIEMKLPSAGGQSAIASACLKHLGNAQSALDDLRLEEVAAHVHRALEETSKLDEVVKSRYGGLITQRLSEQRDALMEVAARPQPEPDASDGSLPPMTRSLAQHLLLSAWSLCGTYFAP